MSYEGDLCLGLKNPGLDVQRNFQLIDMTKKAVGCSSDCEVYRAVREGKAGVYHCMREGVPVNIVSSQGDDKKVTAA